MHVLHTYLITAIFTGAVVLARYTLVSDIFVKTLQAICRFLLESNTNLVDRKIEIIYSGMNMHNFIPKKEGTGNSVMTFPQIFGRRDR